MKTTTTIEAQTAPADENVNNHTELEKTIDSMTEGSSGHIKSTFKILSNASPQNAQVLCKFNFIPFERMEQNLKQEQF
jgi:hypothetical protein